MAKKKAQEKAVKEIEKSVRKAMHKGVSDDRVEETVEETIDDVASSGKPKRKKGSKITLLAKMPKKNPKLKQLVKRLEIDNG